MTRAHAPTRHSGRSCQSLGETVRHRLISLLAGTLLAHAGAQTREAPPRRFKSRIDLVSITATVLDANGKLVSGLTQDEFEVYEDGVPQALTHFGSDRVPIGLGLLLDTSDSMRGSGSSTRARRSRASCSTCSARTTSSS